jgi:catechol 2,3-dioxygenase-like lactoylglutathione lyase family enzyme
VEGAGDVPPRPARDEHRRALTALHTFGLTRYRRLRLHATIEPVPVTQGFNHVATVTADLGRLTKFYVEAFDAKVTFEMAATDDRPRMAIINLGGGAALNVFEVAEESIIGERRTMGGRGPIDHFGLAVDSPATLYRLRKRIVAAGAEIGEIQRLGNEWSLFFRDPDGMELEVCAHAAPDDTAG